MKWLVKFSVERPWTVIIGTIVITVFFAIMLGTKFSINVDPMKSFSRKMDVIKYYHLTQKKFSMKDMILIGVENEKGDIFNVKTLRYVESVINQFKALKVNKTYKNIITDKEAMVEGPSKLSPNQIAARHNADESWLTRSITLRRDGNLTSRATGKGRASRDPDPKR